VPPATNAATALTTPHALDLGSWIGTPCAKAFMVASVLPKKFITLQDSRTVVVRATSRTVRRYVASITIC
jgi:hypothetical protein